MRLLSIRGSLSLLRWSKCRHVACANGFNDTGLRFNTKSAVPLETTSYSLEAFILTRNTNAPVKSKRGICTPFANYVLATIGVSYFTFVTISTFVALAAQAAVSVASTRAFA